MLPRREKAQAERIMSAWDKQTPRLRLAYQKLLDPYYKPIEPKLKETKNAVRIGHYGNSRS